MLNVRKLSPEQEAELGNYIPDLLVARELDRLIREQWDGYYAYHGAINWARHDFDASPNICAYMFSDQTFLDEMVNTCTLTLEMMTKMDAPSEGEEATGINPTVSALMKYDAIVILRKLFKAKRPKSEDNLTGGPVIRSDLIQEISDSNLNVQGIIVRVQLQF